MLVKHRVLLVRPETNSFLFETRPLHWERISTRNPRSFKSDSGRNLQRLAKASALAAATRAPWSRQRNDICKPQTPLQKSKGNCEASCGPPKTPISFAPPFVITSSMSMYADQVEEPDADNDENLPTSVPVSVHRQPRKRNETSKVACGPLSKRLISIRNSIASDSVRLTAFYKNSFDLNDPRKRARTITDITILGDVSQVDGKCTVLGFIHKNVCQGPTSTAYDYASRICWVSFLPATARSLNLKKGSQLRMYNVVFIPCVEVEISGIHWKDATIDNVCRHMIICTQLAESYPESLPKLAPMQDIVQG